MTDTPTPDTPMCRVHGIPCAETTDCDCQECAEQKMVAFLDERNAALNKKMAALSKRYRNLPSSCVFYLDRRALYVYLAEQMLYKLCAKLGLAPMHITLRPDPRLAIPPDADIRAPVSWAQENLGEAFRTAKDQIEIRGLVQTYIRGFVTAAADEFMQEWELVLVEFGYIEKRHGPDDGADSEAVGRPN